MGCRYAILAAVLIGLAISSCTDEKCPACPDKTIEPKPQPLDSIADYTFYLAGGISAGKYIYYYNTTTRELFDSLEIGNWPFSYMTVTNDDRYLILSGTNARGYTYVIETETKSLLHQFQFGGPIEVSRSGNYIAIQGYDLWTLDPQSFDAHIIDTAGYHSIKFDWDHEILYRMNNDNQILPYDLVGDSSLPTIDWTFNGQENFYLKGITPLPEPMGILITAVTQTYYQFLAIYHPETDSTEYLFPGRFDDLAVTPDGTTLLASDPAPDFFPSGDVYGSGNLYIIDLPSATLTEIVEPLDYIEFGWDDPREIVMGSDGRLAWMNGHPWNAGFATFDLRTGAMDFDNPTLFRDDTLWVRHVACSQMLEGE